MPSRQFSGSISWHTCALLSALLQDLVRQRRKTQVTKLSRRGTHLLKNAVAIPVAPEMLSQKGLRKLPSSPGDPDIFRINLQPSPRRALTLDHACSCAEAGLRVVAVPTPGVPPALHTYLPRCLRAFLPISRAGVALRRVRVVPCALIGWVVPAVQPGGAPPL